MTATAAELVRDARIIVCVGCGGVGKTTTSAALGLAGARLGRRTLVLTIDPAKRLADALGLAELGPEPTRLPHAILGRAGIAPPGEVSAMMLDMKRTFDGLVQRFAKTEAERERILRNPIYEHVSDALAGSAEYSAMEKVFELSESTDFDLIVLDTPPSQHALDFLEAPARLMAFLESSLMQIFLHPAFAAGRTGFRLFQRGAARALGTLERLLGVAFLEDISEFLLAFEGMSEGFRERAHLVQDLLFGHETAFVLAAGPGREGATQGASLLDRLDASGAHLAGIVLNRVQLWPGPAPDVARLSGEGRAALEAALGGAGPRASAAADAALEVTRSFGAGVARDARATAGLAGRAAQRGAFLRRIPEFDRDVSDLDGLAAMADLLVTAEASQDP
jgi:anion-transporting  ArsA/GET3 family ATPase